MPGHAISPGEGFPRPRVVRAQKIISLHPSSARAIPSTISFSRAAWSILDCARRTSTFLSCAFREQEDDESALSLSHLRQLREVIREGFHPPGGLAPVEVFVRRMVPMLGQAQPHE